MSDEDDSSTPRDLGLGSDVSGSSSGRDFDLGLGSSEESGQSSERSGPLNLELEEEAPVPFQIQPTMMPTMMPTISQQPHPAPQPAPQPSRQGIRPVPMSAPPPPTFARKAAISSAIPAHVLDEGGEIAEQFIETHKDLTWKILHKYFTENPNYLVAHHIDSFNDFVENGIRNIIRENNPFQFLEKPPRDRPKVPNECKLYLGGKEGNQIYVGRPIIYDENRPHYMFPNEARIRNLTYASTIHVDVDCEIIYYDPTDTKGTTRKTREFTLSHIYLGRIPIMLQSNWCILGGMPRQMRANLGECRNDYGGYFLIDGKEKVIVPQEKFANNMLYIRKYPENSLSDYLYSAEIRSVSEDSSKAIRTTAVYLVAPTASWTNRNIVVLVPNVRAPVPLFILMRALGIVSDREIVRACLLDLDRHADYIDLFIPSVHEAGFIYTQTQALEFMAELVKQGTIPMVQKILSDFFLPHIGELNLLDKAMFIGYMTFRMLQVSLGRAAPTDRDNFRFKRVETSGALLYSLFREYYLVYKYEVEQAIDREYYNHEQYRDTFDEFAKLIMNKYPYYFRVRRVEIGVMMGFKGSWGSKEYTKRLGIVQDINRLSWNSFISHLRKINLPLDSTSKVVGPRLLNSSQWGLIDPVDTPDGGNIGLHKHMAIMTHISSGSPSIPLITWLRSYMPIYLLQECTASQLANGTKFLVNGNWIGVVSDDPLTLVEQLRMYRRNSLLSPYMSISYDYTYNEIHLYTDAGRLMRPIYYAMASRPRGRRQTVRRVPNYMRKHVLTGIQNGLFGWKQLMGGFEKRAEDLAPSVSGAYTVAEMYPTAAATLSDPKEIHRFLAEHAAVVDYMDTAEEESAYIATTAADIMLSRGVSSDGGEEETKNIYYTHVEMDASLLFGVMGNQIIFPEHNPLPRNSFSCGQSKQAVSMYHSGYETRMDTVSVVLNYGQIPLVKSRYLEYFNHEEVPYGVNTIVAIMSYTGYNVEDAILINEGAIQRGLFLTTYFKLYEAQETSRKMYGAVNSQFGNVANDKRVVGLREGYDYSHLNDDGLIRENTPLTDKTILVGRMNESLEDAAVWIDSSVKAKKGQQGYADRAFVTMNEDGLNVAKVRVRENRMPAIGDKMASRAGQKGTIGVILSECDMPFTEDGLKPDLIINPHALPSRMTIGQLVECLFGTAASIYGAFGDCTAFGTEGSNMATYGALLTAAGLSSTGNRHMYSGMTGEPLEAEVFIGPTYYMRLKHMVKDKINYRGKGPNTLLTRQPVHGRSKDGGLRIGEMERDGILAYGMAAFVRESMVERSDEYYLAVCNKTGAVAIYNPSKSVFLSPAADGPLQFETTADGTLVLNTISRFGRSFSILRVPYSLKLFVQEVQTMGIQMRIVTDENADQLLSMCVSDVAEKKLVQRWPEYRAVEADESGRLNTLVGDGNQDALFTRHIEHAKQMTSIAAPPPASRKKEQRPVSSFAAAAPAPAAPAAPASAASAPAFAAALRASAAPASAAPVLEEQKEPEPELEEEKKESENIGTPELVGGSGDTSNEKKIRFSS